jgi:hypothetical protein
MEERMKSLTLVIALIALIIAGDAFLQNGAAANQGKKIISIKATYSVEKVKAPSLLEKLLCSDRTCKPNITCTASSPGEYAKVACTVISAVHKGFRTAALSGVKFAAKNASKFFKNMMLAGKVVTSL